MKNVRTLLVVTTLVGWLPVLVVYLTMKASVAIDPIDTPEPLFFILLYFGLVGFGAFSFHRWIE